RVIFALSAPAELERDDPEARRIAFGEIGEIANVSGQARKAQQRRFARRTRIIAIVEPQSVSDEEITVAKSRFAVCVRCVHTFSPERSSLPVAAATSAGSALDQTA